MRARGTHDKIGPQKGRRLRFTDDQRRRLAAKATDSIGGS
jgi:hypothetical protein